MQGEINLNVMCSVLANSLKQFVALPKVIHSKLWINILSQSCFGF